ncbi:MAG: TGS domain-containing protein, partial [Acidobacteriota bacterium]
EDTLTQTLSQAGFPVTVRPRTKGLGSYYDARKRTLDIGNPESYADFPVILHTENVLDCYLALGIVNAHFSTVPKSIRDFISNPKINGYQSLHVRVNVEGANYLVKIRTAAMDEWAMYGILNDWDAQKPLSDEHWQEVSELLRSIGEYGGAAPQRRELIRLSEAEEVFAYTPRGDIYYLPKGSIVLDFAYRIHSELGDHCEGALVNNQPVPLTHPIKDGETVEILTSDEPLDVDPELEDLCKTPKARTAINRQLQQKRLHYARSLGRQILSQEMERLGLPMSMLEGENVRFILELLNLKDIQDLYVRLGQDLIAPKLFLYYLEPPSESPTDVSAHSHGNILSISDLDRAIHKFARCCNPYPGQEGIVATLSERGATFHQEDCKDLHDRHGLEPQQMLNVKWNMDACWRHPLLFHLQVGHESLTTLIQSLSDLPPGINIRKLESGFNRHDQPIVLATVSFRSFKDTLAFFKRLPINRSIVEDYGREGGAQRSRLAPAPA